MKVCTCFLLFGIFAYTHSSASNASKSPKSDQRIVNLALETVLEFNNKDKEADLKLLSNIQNFITKVKTAIDENGNGHKFRRNLKAQRVKTFTGFIQDVIHILNTYDATAFVEFFDILDDEIKNYHYKGCKFYELMGNYETRKLIAAKLDLIKDKPTSIAKTYINELSGMLKDENYDRNVKEFVDFINSLYKQEAEEDFQKVITDLEAYGRSKSKNSNKHLGMIIKNGVRAIIFDHYTNLNTNVRQNVKEKLETFWKQLEKSPPSSGNIPNDKPYSIISRNNIKNSEINKIKESEPDSKKGLMNLVSKKANKKIEVIKRHDNNREKNDIKQSEYKKAAMKRDDVKNEKKRYIHIRKDTVSVSLDTQEIDTCLSSQYTGSMNQQRTKNEHQEHSTTDSSSGESFSSIELYQKPQHYTTQYTAITPKKISRKPPTNVSKKLKEIEALNVITRMPKNNTVKKIWIEESTGRLPKVVLEKLAVKPSRHESRHNIKEGSLNKLSARHRSTIRTKKKWHGNIYGPKYVKMYEKKYDKKHDKTRMTKHWSKDDTKYELKQKQKSKRDKKHKNVKTSEHNHPFILVHDRDFLTQNYLRTTDSVFNIEVHKYKKSMRPSRVELKQNKRRTTASTKPQKFLKVLDVLIPSKSSKTIKSPQAMNTAPPSYSFIGRLSVTLPRKYSKRNKMVPWTRADHPSSSSEGMTVEQFEIKEDLRRHGQNAKRTSSSLEKDPYVIQRLKNLERQVNEVKSRFNVNIDVVKTRQVNHSDVAKDNIVKRKQFKTGLRSDVNMIPNDFKNKTDKLKMSRTVDNKTERIIEYKDVKDENSINKKIENNLEKSKKYETRFRSDVNMIPNDFKNKTDKPKMSRTVDNKTERIIEYKDVKDENSINKKIENNLEKNKKSETRFRSDVNMIPNDFKNNTDKPKLSRTADNKTERTIDYKNVKGENSINKKIENEKSEARFRSDVNMIPNDFKDSAHKTEATRIEDNKKYVKYIDFQTKEEMIYNDYETIEVTKEQVILKEDKNTETGRTNTVEVTPKTKDRVINVVMNDHHADDASNETGTQNMKIATFSTSTKATESTTKITMTVQPTVAVTTPSTLKLSTASVSISVATSPMLAGVLQKAESNATVDKSKNQMVNNTSQVADVSKTTLNVTKGINK